MMIDRDQQLIEAAMEYLARFERGELPNMDDFVNTFPAELRDELRAYLEEILATDPLPGGAALPEEEQQLGEYIMRRERERLLAEAPVAYGPAPTLSEIRLERRMSLGALARQLNLPVALLGRLERGGILLSTLPFGLLSMMAKSLGRSVAEIRASLDASQQGAGGHLFEKQAGYLSARDGTAIPKETPVPFDEAFMSSNPTPRQRAYWKKHLKR